MYFLGVIIAVYLVFSKAYLLRAGSCASAMADPRVATMAKRVGETEFAMREEVVIFFILLLVVCIPSHWVFFEYAVFSVRQLCMADGRYESIGVRRVQAE